LVTLLHGFGFWFFFSECASSFVLVDVLPFWLFGGYAFFVILVFFCLGSVLFFLFSSYCFWLLAAYCFFLILGLSISFRFCYWFFVVSDASSL